MFDQIGTKIKNLAQIIYWLTLILIEMSAIIMIFEGLLSFKYAWYVFLIGVALAVVSPFLCRISVYFIYGFGELIEKVTLIAEQRDVTGTAPSAVASVAPVTAAKEESAVKESVSTEAPVATERILSEEEREKREQALKKFFEQGLISEEEYRKALGKGV